MEYWKPEYSINWDRNYRLSPNVNFLLKHTHTCLFSLQQKNKIKRISCRLPQVEIQTNNADQLWFLLSASLRADRRESLVRRTPPQDSFTPKVKWSLQSQQPELVVNCQRKSFQRQSSHPRGVHPLCPSPIECAMATRPSRCWVGINPHAVPLILWVGQSPDLPRILRVWGQWVNCWIVWTVQVRSFSANFIPQRWPSEFTPNVPKDRFEEVTCSAVLFRRTTDTWYAVFHPRLWSMVAWVWFFSFTFVAQSKSDEAQRKILPIRRKRVTLSSSKKKGVQQNFKRSLLSVRQESIATRKFAPRHWSASSRTNFSTMQLLFQPGMQTKFKRMGTKREKSILTFEKNLTTESH